MTGSRRRLIPLGLVAVVFGACLPAADSQLPARVEFELPTLDGGEPIGPVDFEGDVVIVDFWASWCAPCRIQHEVLTVLREEYAEEGVSFLAVNSGEPESVARAFAEEHPFGYPVLLDHDSAVSDRLGVVGLPTLMIIDRRGEVSYFEPGLRSPRELRELLSRAGV